GRGVGDGARRSPRGVAGHGGRASQDSSGARGPGRRAQLHVPDAVRPRAGGRTLLGAGRAGAAGGCALAQGPRSARRDAAASAGAADCRKPPRTSWRRAGLQRVLVRTRGDDRAGRALPRGRARVRARERSRIRARGGGGRAGIPHHPAARARLRRRVRRALPQDMSPRHRRRTRYEPPGAREPRPWPLPPAAETLSKPEPERPSADTTAVAAPPAGGVAAPQAAETPSPAAFSGGRGDVEAPAARPTRWHDRLRGASIMAGIGVLAFATGLVLFNSVVMPRLIHGVSEVHVPDLRNLTLEQ